MHWQDDCHIYTQIYNQFSTHRRFIDPTHEMIQERHFGESDRWPCHLVIVPLQVPKQSSGCKKVVSHTHTHTHTHTHMHAHTHTHTHKLHNISTLITQIAFYSLNYKRLFFEAMKLQCTLSIQPCTSHTLTHIHTHIFLDAFFLAHSPVYLWPWMNPPADFL